MKKRTYIEVDYSDLNEEILSFLQEKFPELEIQEYEMVAEQEWGNDEEHTADVKPKLPDQYYMNRMKKGNFSFELFNILDWMCYEGKLEEGDYLISISW